MTDYPDYQTPKAHANEIAATGVPLLTASALVFDVTQSPTGGSSLGGGVNGLSQIGYEFYITATIPAAATIPFVRFAIAWKDSASGLTVATDTHVIPAGTSPALFTVRGYGPTKGDQMTWTVTNLDPSQTVTVRTRMLQNSRVYPRDRWSWVNSADSGIAVPGWTLPVLPADESVLGMESAATVGAGASVSWLCAMHNGLVNFGLDLGSGALSNLAVAVAAEPASEYVSNNPIYGAVNPPPNFQVACPRAPFRFQLHNSGTASISVTWSAIAAD